MEHLEELQSKEVEFKYDGKLEYTYECLKKVFNLSIDKMQYLKKQHEKYKYLFNKGENEDIEEKDEYISAIIHRYVSEYDSLQFDTICEMMDEICLGIDCFWKEYKELIENKINDLLYK